MVCYRKRVDVEERFGDIAQKISEKYIEAYENRPATNLIFNIVD
jgi:hypothetical protein